MVVFVVSGENYPDFSAPPHKRLQNNRRMAKSTLFWFAEDIARTDQHSYRASKTSCAVISWKGGSEARRGSNRALRANRDVLRNGCFSAGEVALRDGRALAANRLLLAAPVPSRV